MNAVVINEVYDEEKYQTWIYFYDDAIYEMFVDEETPFDLADGMKVVEADSFNIEEVNNSLYKFTAVSKEESAELSLCLYSN
jgi:hypothetical protein